MTLPVIRITTLLVFFISTASLFSFVFKTDFKVQFLYKLPVDLLNDAAECQFCRKILCRERIFTDLRLLPLQLIHLSKKIRVFLIL